jgi:hypothetical protein
MYKIKYEELNKILGNLNRKEDLTYADILSAIQSKYPGLADQLEVISILNS